MKPFKTFATALFIAYWVLTLLLCVLLDLWTHQCAVQKGTIQGFQCVKPAQPAKALNIKWMT